MAIYKGTWQPPGEPPFDGSAYILNKTTGGGTAAARGPANPRLKQRSTFRATIQLTAYRWWNFLSPTARQSWCLDPYHDIPSRINMALTHTDPFVAFTAASFARNQYQPPDPLNFAGLPLGGAITFLLQYASLSSQNIYYRITWNNLWTMETWPQFWAYHVNPRWAAAKSAPLHTRYLDHRIDWPPGDDSEDRVGKAQYPITPGRPIAIFWRFRAANRYIDQGISRIMPG